MKPPLRVALFADSFYEPNGVATLSREFVRFAQERQLPFCCVRAGDRRQASASGSVTTLELNRGFASFPLDKDLRCDPLLTRHRPWILRQMAEFRPDLIHITGPGDFGTLGFWVSHTLRVPMAASWHTNVHEYASQRLQSSLSWMPRTPRQAIGKLAEDLSLKATMSFYGLAHFVMAPNQEMVDELHRRTNRPSYLMGHGVDTARFSPTWRKRTNGNFSIGYVGRLTPEKNLRWFRELERELVAAGSRNFRLILVGDGRERDWLRTNLKFGELPGVLRGEDLSAAFANLDVFVFPSQTDTFGLVILEAMASGVPVVVTPETGERVHVPDGVAGFLSQNFTQSVLRLMRDETLRSSMGSQARQFACSQAWSQVFQDVYRTYGVALEREDVRGRIRPKRTC